MEALSNVTSAVYISAMLHCDLQEVIRGTSCQQESKAYRQRQQATGVAAGNYLCNMMGLQMVYWRVVTQMRDQWFTQVSALHAAQQETNE
jgi:hypothetical protein